MKKLTALFLILALQLPLFAANFSKVKMIVGDVEVDVLLSVKDGKVTVLAKKSHQVIDEITPASGEYFFTDRKHWLTLHAKGNIRRVWDVKTESIITMDPTPGDAVSFRLDKNNFDEIVAETDVWFTGPDGARWWGYQLGEWTQIVHCRRGKGAA